MNWRTQEKCQSSHTAFCSALLPARCFHLAKELRSLLWRLLCFYSDRVIRTVVVRCVQVTVRKTPVHAQWQKTMLCWGRSRGYVEVVSGVTESMVWLTQWHDNKMFHHSVCMWKRAISSTTSSCGTSLITRRTAPGNVCQPGYKLYFVIMWWLILLLRYLSEMKGSRYLPYLCFWRNVEDLLKCCVGITDRSVDTKHNRKNSKLHFQFHCTWTCLLNSNSFINTYNLFLSYNAESSQREGWDLCIDFYLHLQNNTF